MTKDLIKPKYKLSILKDFPVSLALKKLGWGHWIDFEIDNGLWLAFFLRNSSYQGNPDSYDGIFEAMSLKAEVTDAMNGCIPRSLDNEQALQLFKEIYESKVHT